MSGWTRWAPFPDPRRGDFVCAPIGHGVYELRDRKEDKFVLVGIGKNCASRLCSLLPAPLGQGTRRNSKKRRYVLKHVRNIEYRTYPCSSDSQARLIEKQRLASEQYVFQT